VFFFFLKYGDDHAHLPVSHALEALLEPAWILAYFVTMILLLIKMRYTNMGSQVFSSDDDYFLSFFLEEHQEACSKLGWLAPLIHDAVHELV